MLLSLIKRLFRPLGVLLFLTPNFSLAQSDGDSTFNGIDYHAGRIVRGFGGGVEQFIGNKTEVGRRFATNPFMYTSIGGLFGIQLSNHTEWQKIDEEMQLIPSALEKATTQLTSLQVRHRPTSGLLLSVGGSYFSHQSKAYQAFEYNFSNHDYSFTARYLSQSGLIRLTPKQLAWMYYGGDFYLSEKQVMFNLSGSLSKASSNSQAVNFISFDDSSRTIKTSGSGNGRGVTANLIYGVTSRLTLLQDLVLSSQINEDERSNDPEYSYFRKAESSVAASSSRLRYIGPWQTLHQLYAEYLVDSQKDSRRIAVVNGKQWRGGYRIQQLSKVDTPALAALLADWQNIFGRQLPKGGIYFSAEISGARNTDQPIGTYTSPADEYLRYLLGARSLSASMNTSYGLSNPLALSFVTTHARQTSEERYEDGSRPASVKRSYWNSSLSLQFTNYRYEEKFKSRFGWDEISEFDRMYGPLLLPGMVKGNLSIYMWRYSLSQKSGNNHFSSNPSRQGATIGARCGIKGNLELAWDGGVDHVGGSGRTTKYLNLAVAWQPWQSIRLQLTRHSNDIAIGSSWDVRLMTLF